MDLYGFNKLLIWASLCLGEEKIGHHYMISLYCYCLLHNARNRIIYLTLHNSKECHIIKILIDD